jgi:basic membrane protein A
VHEADERRCYWKVLIVCSSDYEQTRRGLDERKSASCSSKRNQIPSQEQVRKENAMLGPRSRNGLALLALLLASAIVLNACVGAPAAPTEKPEEKIKVAMLMAVSCDDTGWGTPACEGIREAAQEYDVEYSISEKVAIADAEAAVRDYSERGFDLIIGHGFQYSDPIDIVADDYPDVMYAIYAGAAEGDNVVPIDPKNHENGYLAGIIAGYMTESKVIGAIGGMDIPTVVRVLEGFCQGAQSVDPEIECLYAYPGSWDDIQKGKEAAQAMIDAGADVFFHDASLVGVGMIQATAEAGVYAIGFGTCQDDAAPEAVLTSAIDGIAETMVLTVDMFVSGELQQIDHMRPGMADGIFTLCPYNNIVPQEAREAVDEARSAIINGEIVIEEVLVPSP